MRKKEWHGQKKEEGGGGGGGVEEEEEEEEESLFKGDALNEEGSDLERDRATQV